MKGPGTFVMAGILPLLALGASAWAGDAGDVCEVAIPIACGESVLGSTVGASSETLGFCGTTDGTGGAVWYSVVGTGTEITANLCNPGTDYDTKLRVFTGACDALECVGGNDDFTDDDCIIPDVSPSPRASRFTWCSTEGQTYYILVHGFSSAEGAYELDVTCGEEFCCDGSILGITIQLDEFPGETTWEVVDKDSLEVVASGGPYETEFDLVMESVCVDPKGCYTFTIFDAFSDGICCDFGEGFYEVTLDDELVGEGGEFGASESVQTGFCPCEGDEITVEITFDDFPTETTWEITDAAKGTVVASGGPYPGKDFLTISEDICLPVGCYDFTIFDSFGDGICCEFGEGSYSVFLNGELVGSGGEFESSETTENIGTDCPCEDELVRIEIQLDDFPAETTWEVVDKDSLKVIASGGPYPGQDFELIEEELCLSDGCYTFTIFDSFGDGICCEFGDGSYRVLLNGVLQGFGGEFGDSESTEFGGTCPEGNPSLSLDLASGECVGKGEEVVVTLSMSNMGGFPAAGYQAFLGYDSSLLSFNSATYSSDPYGEHIILGGDINPAEGELNLAAGVDLLGGQPDSAADALLVTLSFTALASGGCEGNEGPVFFRDFEHSTQFTDRAGTPEIARTFDAPPIADVTPPDVSDCPGDIGTNADAGGCDADVSWTPPTVSDNCDPAPSLVYEVDLDSDGSVDFTTEDAGATFPAGDHTVTAVATDECGNENDSCSFSVSVSATNTLVISGLELQATVVSPLSRCITFEIESCAGDGGPIVISQEVEFIDGLAADIELEIDCGDYICVSARDELHTLASTADLSIGDGDYAADLSGNPLLGGDLNDDGVIEILDFGIFIDKLSQFVDLTDCDSKGPNADINGNGLVFTEDYTFIQINFLAVDQVCCELGLLAGPQGRTSISVGELVARGLGHLAVADLNRDGWVDTADMAAFASGVRPGDRRPMDTGVGALKK